MTHPEAAPDPHERNWIWRIVQLILQNVFVSWFRYRARGQEHLPESGALLLINHQSYLDPLLVGLPLRRPVSYLARDNLFRVPIVGWILKNTYVMPIRREAAGTESIRKSIERLQQGYYVGIFPEGTRTRDGRISPLKPGFVALVRRTDVPVIPVGIAGAHQAFPKGSWWMKPLPIRVVFGPPISASEVARLCVRGRESEFVDVIRNRLEDCLRQAEAWRAAGRSR